MYFFKFAHVKRTGAFILGLLSSSPALQSTVCRLPCNHSKPLVCCILYNWNRCKLKPASAYAKILVKSFLTKDYHLWRIISISLCGILWRMLGSKLILTRVILQLRKKRFWLYHGKFYSKVSWAEIKKKKW